jgi:hypothetical protein
MFFSTLKDRLTMEIFYTINNKAKFVYYLNYDNVDTTPLQCCVAGWAVAGIAYM